MYIFDTVGEPVQINGHIWELSTSTTPTLTMLGQERKLQVHILKVWILLWCDQGVSHCRRCPSQNISQLPLSVEIHGSALAARRNNNQIH